ncbi:MAG: menaquinone biosynthesis family protein [Phycisphaerae bacterium]
MLIRIAHSPDPDDAFMFYGLSQGGVASGKYNFEHILDDIQTLNERAKQGVYEVSAISIHAFPYVSDRYALMACGSSMGDGYGPMIVTRKPMSIEELRGKIIAIPGKMTTAFLALQLLLGKAAENGADGAFRTKVVMFDEIPAAVKSGEVDAGLLIHEGQLTYEKEGLHLVVDLGVWWQEKTGLPLPLGGNVVRRDLGDATCQEITKLIKDSIQYSLDHRDEAVKYALKFGRGLDLGLADQFVGMYVNDWTVDYGDRGREAVRRILQEGANAGLVPDAGEIEFIG